MDFSGECIKLLAPEMVSGRIFGVGFCVSVVLFNWVSLFLFSFGVVVLFVFLGLVRGLFLLGFVVVCFFFGFSGPGLVLLCLVWG